MNKQQTAAVTNKAKTDAELPPRVNAEEINQRFRELQARRPGLYDTGRFGRMGLKRQGGGK